MAALLHQQSYPQLQELDGVEVSPTLISNVSEAMMDEVRQSQA